MSENEEAKFLIPDELCADTRMAEQGDVCEGLLLDANGTFDPARLGVGRKRICQWLGIGDSTFTGWIQAGRIPRPAAIAHGLHRNLQHRVRQIGDLRRERLDPRVVRVDGKFAVCEFVENKHGEIEGRLVATGISDQGVAHDLARRLSRAFADDLANAIEMLRFYQESDPDQLQLVGEIADKLEMYKDRHRIEAPFDTKPEGNPPAEVEP
jgi:hypothetical protein